MTGKAAPPGARSVVKVVGFPRFARARLAPRRQARVDPGGKVVKMGQSRSVEDGCSHLESVDRSVKPHSKGCEECLKMGDRWVHLRLCMQCGHVGCCDDSKNRHATKHFHATQHPIVRSLEPGESWGWCFVDQVGFDPL